MPSYNPVQSPQVSRADMLTYAYVLGQLCNSLTCLLHVANIDDNSSTSTANYDVCANAANACSHCSLNAAFTVCNCPILAQAELGIDNTSV